MALMHVARVAKRRLLPEIESYERFLARGGEDAESEGAINTQVRRSPPMEAFCGVLMELTGCPWNRLEVIMADP